MREFLIKYLYLFVNLAIVLFTTIFLSIPFVGRVNTLFTDLLQGEVPVRNEIVIVGIDDKSLQEIDSWPWKREVTANLINKILEGNPRAVGLDVLIVDHKEGDEKLAQVLSDSKVPIVMAAKYEDNQTYEPYFIGKNIVPAFVNFPTDIDGKVRSSYESYANQKSCFYSFSYALYLSYRHSLPAKQCWPTSATTYTGNEFHGLSYSKAPFKTISASDILQERIDKRDLENKIVLIGATTTDIASNLSDNFFDIFGRKVPGVLIHAQAMNTYLDNIRFDYVPFTVYLVAILLATSLYVALTRRFIGTLWGGIALIASIVLIFVVCIVLYEFGIIVPFISLLIIFVSAHFSSVALRYIEEARKNKVISDSFSKYVNPYILKKIVAQPLLLKLGGDKRRMTVFFCDIRGFTTFSEKLTPEELVDTLNKYLDGMSEVILKHLGTIDKYIGDAIMAFWNAPVDDPKHALHAIETVLELKDVLQKLNEKYAAGANLSIGVGINTGDMVVGNIGSLKRFSYTVLGDQVNLASRLEGLTKKYKVFAIVSENTVKELGSDLEGKIMFRQLDIVQVKGRSQATAIYEPLQYSEANLELTNKYMKAFVLYQEGEFDKATDILAELEEHDGPSLVLAERIRHIDRSAKFSGVWVWDEK